MLLKIVKYLLALILIIPAVISFTGLISVESSDSIAEVKTNYYSLLDTISTSSHHVRTKKLVRFLKLNSTFTQVYHRLYDEYMLEDKVDSAGIVFSHFLQMPEYRYNSLWVMAKIYQSQDKPLNALKCYKEIIQSGSISMPLLKDMVEFDHYWSGKYKIIAYLKERFNDNDTLNCIKSFNTYIDLNYQEAIQHIKKIQGSLKYDTNILFIYGASYYCLFKYDKADSIWSFGLKTARETQKVEEESKFLSNLALTKSVKNNPEEAINE